MTDFIDNYENDEYEGTFESPLSKKRRGRICRSEKGNDFNEAFKKNLREINSNSRRTKKSLA